MGIKSNQPTGKKLTERVWEELKKINWRDVNRLTSQPFAIGLVATEPVVTQMRQWLSSFPYKISYDSIHKTEQKKFTMSTGAQDKLVVFDPSHPIDERLAKSMSFCIVQKDSINDVRRLQVVPFIFDPAQDGSMVSDILSNNEDLRFALSYNFPVFRPDCARSEINATALQNATWAVGTAAPNVIPGPQQVVTAPIEAISDFAVLTTNEVKMMFELLGVSGYKVNPLKAVVEFSALVSLAKVAQMTATQVTGKIPAGTGLVVKGAIAYAFTYAIGEAVFFYVSTGQKVGKDFFDQTIPIYFEKGKKIVADLIDRMKGKST